MAEALLQESNSFEALSLVDTIDSYEDSLFPLEQDVIVPTATTSATEVEEEDDDDDDYYDEDRENEEPSRLPSLRLNRVHQPIIEEEENNDSVRNNSFIAPTPVKGIMPRNANQSRANVAPIRELQYMTVKKLSTESGKSSEESGKTDKATLAHPQVTLSTTAGTEDEVDYSARTESATMARIYHVYDDSFRSKIELLPTIQSSSSDEGDQDEQRTRYSPFEHGHSNDEGTTHTTRTDSLRPQDVSIRRTLAQSETSSLCTTCVVKCGGIASGNGKMVRDFIADALLHVADIMESSSEEDINNLVASKRGSSFLEYVVRESCGLQVSVEEGKMLLRADDCQQIVRIDGRQQQRELLQQLHQCPACAEKASYCV